MVTTSQNYQTTNNSGDRQYSHLTDPHKDIWIPTMGFWKRNKEKITADTISGLLIRVLAGALLIVLGGVVIRKFPPLQVDNVIIKELIDLVYRVFFFVLFLREILSWLGERRQDRNKEWELKNDNLQLENENLKLKLELQRQEKQSQPDNDE